MNDMIFNIYYRMKHGDRTIIHNKQRITWDEFKALDSLNCIEIINFTATKK